VSDYPRLPILRDSTCEVLSGHEPARATNGTLHMRRAFTGDKRNFMIVHVMTTAQRATLTAHYAADKDNAFNFVWPEDGQTYSVSYSAAPQWDKAGTNFHRARVNLMER
jgi:hypothetical protein